MGVNNVNLFEQHVEKAVLAVAAAGALFMGYLAIQPVTVPAIPGIPSPSGGEALRPDDIELMISQQLDNLEKQQAALPAPNSAIPNYLGMYKKLSSSSPLADDVTNAPVATFGPKNLQPQNISIDSGEQTIQLATPNPVAPEFVHAEARQDQVAAVAIDPANPIPAGMQVQTRTQNSVVIDGYVPLGKMLVEMLQDKYKDYTAQQGVQRALIYRVAVERREQTPNGWSEWKAVTPTKAAPAPTEIPLGAIKDGELPPNMDVIDNEFKQIVIPDFYQDGQGIVIPAPILIRPVPPTIVEETRKLQEQIDSLKAPTGFRTVAATTTAPSTQPTTMPADLPSLKSLAVVPFTFWDDTVQSDRTYQYRVEIQIVNPTLGWKWGLKDPKMKLVPLLSTGKVTIQQTVTVHSDIAFFISVGAGNAVSGMIFKQTGGKWYQGSFDALPGQKIVSSIALVDEPGNRYMDADTGFTVVDAIPSRDGAKVILKDPSGNLIARDARTDWDSEDRQKLLQQVQKRQAATTTAPDPNLVTPTPTTGRFVPPTPVQTRPVTPRGIPVNPRTP